MLLVARSARATAFCASAAGLCRTYSATSAALMASPAGQRGSAGTRKILHSSLWDDGCEIAELRFETALWRLQHLQPIVSAWVCSCKAVHGEPWCKLLKGGFLQGIL